MNKPVPLRTNTIRNVKIAYRNMLQRCYNPNNPSYRYYGAIGITICARWLESFDNFYADMGLKPHPSYEIDRINNHGNYEPSNCRWAPKPIQNRNRRCVRAAHRSKYKEKLKRARKTAEILAVAYHDHLATLPEPPPTASFGTIPLETLKRLGINPQG